LLAPLIIRQKNLPKEQTKPSNVLLPTLEGEKWGVFAKRFTKQ